MQKNILQKSLTILLTAFISVFLFGGTGILSEKAYAAPDPAPATPTKSTEEVCKENSGTYNPDGSCFIPKGTDCSSLGTEYEKKQPPDSTGIICQKSVTASKANTEQEKVLKERIYVIIAIQKWLNTLIWPVLVMIGDLMNNNILFGAGMDERLREIWIPVRNLINLFFVLAMVGIAIYNILGIGDDNDTYSIKQILPKIIIAIIAVNFSFIGIKVFLDGINVLTASIFALPDQTKEGLGNVAQDPETIKRFCLGTMGQSVDDVSGATAGLTAMDVASYKIVILQFAEKNKSLLTDGNTLAMLKSDLNLGNLSISEIENTIFNTYFTAEGKQKLAQAINEYAGTRVCTNDSQLTPRGKAFLTTYSSSNAALAMALNMSKIVFYQEIDITTLTEANISKLFINTIFSIAMYLIYVVSFLALFVVLLARLVVMWLGIVASPIIIVSMILPVFKEKLGFGDLVDKFVQNAIAPILIAFSMTVGWIMLKAVQSVNTLSSDVPKIVNGIPVAGLNTIQDLIVALGTVGVIWMAVSSAANKSIAEPVTKAMYGGLASAGSFVGNIAWKHAPLFPVTIPGQPDKTMMTPEILGQVMKDAKYKYQDKESDTAKMVSQALGLRGAEEKRLSDLTDAKNSKEALNILKTESNLRNLENGGSEADDNLEDFIKRDKGRFRKDLEEGKMGTNGAGFKNLMEDFEKADGDEPKRKEIRKKMAEYLKQHGKTMEDDWDKIEAGGAKPKAAPAHPPAVTEHDKIGTAEIGKDHVKQIADATDKLVVALKDPKTTKGDDLKAQIKAFELNGQKPLLPQLKAFISDPEAKKRLEEIFHSDADLQKVASAGQVPGTNVPKGAQQPPVEAQQPEAERMARVTPPQAQPTSPVNPLAASLIEKPESKQVSDAGDKGQPPQPNAGQPPRPEEEPPAATGNSTSANA